MKYEMTEIIQDEFETSSNCVMEVVSIKQVLHEKTTDYDPAITSSTHAGNIGIKEIGDEANEVVLLAVLDTKNKINALHRVFTGTLNSSIAHPREIFRTALLNNAARIMVFHNHPSGSTEPSDADISFTKRLCECGELLGIEVLDHIIVTNESYFSLKEYSLM